MRHHRLLLAVMIAGLSAVPVAADIFAGEVSSKAASSLSVQVDPQLSDGRLVVKVAAKNGGQGAIPFGSANLVLTAADGSQVAWRPLAKLVADVEAAYGLETVADDGGMLAGSTAANSAPSRGAQPDVSNYTGGSAVAQTEAINSGSRTRKRRKASASDRAKAEAEIAQLKGAVLQQQSLPSGGVTAGTLVSEKLPRKVAGGPVTLTVTVGSDRYSFNFNAPAAQ